MKVTVTLENPTDEQRALFNAHNTVALQWHTAATPAPQPDQNDLASLVGPIEAERDRLQKRVAELEAMLHSKKNPGCDATCLNYCLHEDREHKADMEAEREQLLERIAELEAGEKELLAGVAEANKRLDALDRLRAENERLSRELAEAEKENGDAFDTLNRHLFERNEALSERDAARAELARSQALHKAALDEMVGLDNERLRQLDAAQAECERLKAPHAKDCAYLLNGKKPGRWDCDCDASEVKRLEAEIAAMTKKYNDMLIEAEKHHIGGKNAMDMVAGLRAELDAARAECERMDALAAKWQADYSEASEANRHLEAQAARMREVLGRIQKMDKRAADWDRQHNVLAYADGPCGQLACDALAHLRKLAEGRRG